jgi:hypothetical protein
MSSACHNLLLSSLSIYYKKQQNNRKTLKDVIDGSSILSLRVIDWFVTHYAKNHNIIYWIDDQSKSYTENIPLQPDIHVRKFHLYMEYRAQLQSYTKMFFDPFRRHERITFVLENDPLVSIETTVGQLNFFRWAFQNHVFEYILAHLQQIEDTMAKFQKELKKQNKNSTSPNLPTIEKKDTHIQNIVLRTPCFIRFD